MVARVLLVGCGCRGRELARALAEDGQLVRGTTRDPDKVAAVAAACGEAAVADPDRLGTLLAPLAGVSVVCWLMGSAEGPPAAVAALHGPRLTALLQKLVDTPVRGLVYEGAGTVDPRLLAEGAAAVRAAAATHRMPVSVVAERPQPLAPWLTAMRAAVRKVLSA